MRRGDVEALAEVWRYFGDDLRRRARTRLRQYGIAHETESMDICNAVLMDLVRQGQVHLEKPNEVLHYVMRAIDNEVRDAFRQLSRLRRDFRRLDQQPVEQHPIAALQSSPSAEIVRKEIFNQVREYLNPEDQPIVDWVLQNDDWPEIGKRLGVEPDTARMRFQRAVRRARERFAANDDAT